MPSSSLRLLDYALAVMSLVSSYIIQSMFMNFPCMNLDNSIDINRELETKFYIVRNQVPKEMINFFKQAASSRTFGNPSNLELKTKRSDFAINL